MSTTRRLICVVLVAALAACSSPEAGLQSGLVRAGLPQPIAACMAPRMIHRLSLLQLRRLSGLGKATHSENIDQFLYRLRALNDDRIVGVAASSAALCAVGLG